MGGGQALDADGGPRGAEGADPGRVRRGGRAARGREFLRKEPAGLPWLAAECLRNLRTVKSIPARGVGSAGNRAQVPGVRGEISDSEYGHQPYSITVHIDEALAGISANGIMDQLKNTEPRVWVRAVRSSAALG